MLNDFCCKCAIRVENEQNIPPPKIDIFLKIPKITKFFPPKIDIIDRDKKYRKVPSTKIDVHLKKRLFNQNLAKFGKNSGFFKI